MQSKKISNAKMQNENTNSAQGIVGDGLGVWQPIETAPRDGSDILVYGRGNYSVAYWSGKEWRDIGDIGWAGIYGDEGNQPTHWIPLPASPESYAAVCSPE